jgi:D-alanyl-D-alanine carboxypeptidase/D-alanyl-D-alanine-endopeptidase (penicillin-binding protein 4)
MLMNNLLISLFISLLSVLSCYADDWTTDILKPLKGGSIVVQDPSGNTLFSHNADKEMVPASILKIATADAVLTNLGQDYHIKTEFYLTKNNYLGVKGFGDPTLTSESLLAIARQLKKKLKNNHKRPLKGFWLDTSFFKPNQKVHGQSNSNNPYDSSVGALLANFNTININRTRKGALTSAEPQTPLTPTAISLAKRLPPGKHRINIGKNNTLTLRYFSELLQLFLKKEGISIPLKIIDKKIPENSKKIHVHQSKKISNIIKSLLKFSNNLIANQLFIILGGELKGAPADLNKGRQVVTEFLNNTVGINHFTLEEGSGLSRNNQFTAAQMMRLLIHFTPYQDLLRIDRDRFQAKTGTLKGVSTYAGYMLSPSGENYPYVIMMNKSRRGSDRYKVANIMYDGLFKKTTH